MLLAVPSVSGCPPVWVVRAAAGVCTCWTGRGAFGLALCARQAGARHAGTGQRRALAAAYLGVGRWVERRIIRGTVLGDGRMRDNAGSRGALRELCGPRLRRRPLRPGPPVVHHTPKALLSHALMVHCAQRSSCMMLHAVGMESDGCCAPLPGLPLHRGRDPHRAPYGTSRALPIWMSGPRCLLQFHQ